MIQLQKGVIKKGNKFLIVLRAPDSKRFPKHWDFPGGKLEPGEKPTDGLIREVFEETSLKIKPLKLVGVYDLDLDNIGKLTHKFNVYSTEVLSGEVKLSHEHTDFKWATKEEILKLKIEPYMRLFFKDN